MTFKPIALASAAFMTLGLAGCNPPPAPELLGSSETLSSPLPVCAANQTVDSIVLSSSIPCDYTDGRAKDPTSLARFAWNTFIAMNWPAVDPFQAPYNRGVPDVSKSIGGDATAVVWDTWREKRELFLVEEYKKPNAPEKVAYKFVEPPTFNDGTPPSPTGPVNPISPTGLTASLNMCPTVTEIPNKFVTALQTNKVENYLDETDEIGLAVLWRGDLTMPGNTALLASEVPMPDDRNLVRYQVKFGPTHYTHVRDQNLWDTTTLNNLITKEKSSGNGIGVELPSGDNTTKNTGSILVKTAWMKLSSVQQSGGAYYTQTALYYRKINGQVCFEYDEFALIAIHVIRKTDAFPYFFFSTFQHKENYPGKFVYANTNGPANNPNLVSSTLKNPFGITYKDPANPTPATTTKPIVSDPYHATRLIKELPSVATANAEAAGKLAGTVWANYELVGFQYRPVDKPSGTPGSYYAEGSPPTTTSSSGKGYYPNYYSDQEYYLANPVVETNQRFQFFEGGFGAANVKNIALYPSEVSPVLPGDGMGFPKTVDMGGCMGCHGNAQTTDFSFTLNNATFTPTGFSTGTIEEVCGEIGLAYNGSDACQAKAP